MNISNTTLYTLLTISIIVGIFIQMIGNIRGAYFTIPIVMYLFLKTTPYQKGFLGRISAGFHGGVFGAIALASLPWIDSFLGGINGGLFTNRIHCGSNFGGFHNIPTYTIKTFCNKACQAEESTKSTHLDVQRPSGLNQCGKFAICTDVKFVALIYITSDHLHQ